LPSKKRHEDIESTHLASPRRRSLLEQDEVVMD
jgi:hypothetical protein